MAKRGLTFCCMCNDPNNETRSGNAPFSMLHGVVVNGTKLGDRDSIM